MDCIIPSRLLSIWTTQIKRSQLGKNKSSKNAGCKLPKKEQGVERESCRLRPGVLREGASCPVHNNLTQQLTGFGKRYKFPRTLAAQRLSCTLGSPGSLFCYVARWKQLQKSLNLPSRGRVVSIHPQPEITWARGLSSVVGGFTPHHSSTSTLWNIYNRQKTKFPSFTSHSSVPSVLWRCWLGDRKGIRPVKKRVVGCWSGCLSGARCRLAYGPADATATNCLLLQ